MPELPEVETIVRCLRPQLRSRRIARVEVSGKRLRQHWSPAWETTLRGRRILKLRRRGKWIVLDLDRRLCLLIHLGMTGQLRVVDHREERAPHTHLVLRLTPDRTELRFRDVRRFGSVQLLSADAATEILGDGRLGPEPSALKAAHFFQKVCTARRSLKAILLDQRTVAGLGNIYADEALFEARIHPARLGCKVQHDESRRLCRAMVTVLRRAIDKRGSSIRDYLDGNGEAGNYQREFRVYGQTGEPCRRCRTPIARIRLAGRSTHFCPNCQK